MVLEKIVLLQSSLRAGGKRIGSYENGHDEAVCVVHPGYTLTKVPQKRLTDSDVINAYGDYNSYLGEMIPRIDELREEFPIFFFLERNFSSYEKPVVFPKTDDFVLFTKKNRGLPYAPAENEFSLFLENCGIEKMKFMGESSHYSRTFGPGCLRQLCDIVLSHGISVEPIVECSFPLKPMKSRDPYYTKKTLGINDVTPETAIQLSEKYFDMERR